MNRSQRASDVNCSSTSPLAILIGLLLSVLTAEALSQPGGDLPPRPPQGRDRILVIPETDRPPVVDGRLDDRAWRTVAVAERFWISEQERWPTEQTEVLITSDRTHLYFAFKVYDRSPEAIEALQARRDGALGFDDRVTVELDPFLTYREISTFSVNARGTQTDSFAGGRARQLAWKGDWNAAVSRTDYGWAAEIAIPYEILNFQLGTHAVGINFVRYHHRTAEWSRWADTTVRALPEEMGRLTGLRPSEVGRKQPWTLLPYVLAGRHIPNREGEIRENLVAAGVDIRYELRPNLTGVISLLPDFSQVERAVTSVDFSYNEKFRSDLRPFFQEGAAYFGDIPSGDKTPATSAYFYSNRVPDFDYGLKAFGRADGSQFGALVMRAPGNRTDVVANFQRQFDRTHNLSAMLVSTDRTDLRNQLYVLRGSGREPSGFNYAFDAAATRTDPAPGDGSFARGALGWGQGFWSVGGTSDRYSRDFFPANGLLARDLPDTTGHGAFVSYYRDRPEGALREVRGDLTWNERETGEGRLQRRKVYAGGSVELRERQVRLGGGYSAGPYRPVGATAGSWSGTTNDDSYWSINADFNTRSSRLGYGVGHAFGQLGGGDYRYSSAYVWAKPTRALAIGLTSELLENFGTYRQSVATGTWDVAPQHTVAGRYIRADYGNSHRLAWVWRARPDLDVFAVYDDVRGLPVQFSVKFLMTLR